MQFPALKALRQALFPALMATALAGLWSAGSACNPPIHLSSETSVHPALQKQSVADLAKLLNRQAEPAEDIQISATLWDLSFIVAFQEARATRRLQSPQVAKANIAAWRQRFIQGQTSFRVRIELLNRPEVTEGQDRILRFREWSFKLMLSDGKSVPYQHIHVELSKRWKVPGGLYHHRLDGTVHFAGRPLAGQHRWIELWVFPPGDRPVAKLRWNLKRR